MRKWISLEAYSPHYLHPLTHRVAIVHALSFQLNHMSNTFQTQLEKYKAFWMNRNISNESTQWLKVFRMDPTSLYCRSRWIWCPSLCGFFSKKYTISECWRGNLGCAICKYKKGYFALFFQFRISFYSFCFSLVENKND